MGDREQGTGARKGRGESAIRKASQKMRNSGGKRDGRKGKRSISCQLLCPLPRPAPHCPQVLSSSEMYVDATYPRALEVCPALACVVWGPAGEGGEGGYG